MRNFINLSLLVLASSIITISSSGCKIMGGADEVVFPVLTPVLPTMTATPVATALPTAVPTPTVATTTIATTTIVTTTAAAHSCASASVETFNDANAASSCGFSKIAQQFPVSSTGNLDSIEFESYSSSYSPCNSVTVKVYTDRGYGNPDSGTLVATATESCSNFTTSWGWNEIIFSSGPELQAGNYWITFSVDTGSFWFKCHSDENTYAGGDGCFYNRGWLCSIDAFLYDYNFIVNICD